MSLARAKFALAEAASLIFLLINEGRPIEEGATKGIFAEWNFYVGGMPVPDRERGLGILRLVT